MLIERKNRPQRLVAQEKHPQRLMALSKRPQRFVVWEKLPKSEITFKGTLNTFSNLFIRSTCTVGIMKSNGEAHLFLQEVLEWHLIFFGKTFTLFIEAVPQSEVSFKLTVYTFSNLPIKIHVTYANEEQRRRPFIFAGPVRMTLWITLHIFRTTFALFIEAVPFTMATYKSLLTSRRCHWGWPKRQWTWGHIMCLD